MVGCRLCGSLLLSVGLAALALKLNDGSLGAAIDASVSRIQVSVDEQSAFEVASRAIPIWWTLQLVRDFSNLALAGPWYAFLIAALAGLLLLLRRSWHSNSRGRPNLDGFGLLGIAFIGAWNLGASVFIVHSIWGRTQEMLSGPINGQLGAIWVVIPLWGRSLVCFISICIWLIAARRVVKREYTGVYWLVGAAITTIADNSLSMILSGLDGVRPLTCVLACWPSVTAIAVWWYFLKSDRALEYFD